MIPVLICPIISRPDLLRRMLTSVDQEVERLVIVDNTPAHDLKIGRRGAHYIRPIIGLGYAGGFNAGVSQTPDAPWWLLASNDIVFGPGDLTNIVAAMSDADGPTVVTGSTRGSRCLRWTYAAVNAATIAAVGLVDEWNFFPIYFDDVDYERRCELGGVRWVEYDGSILHGDGGDRGSTTIQEPAMNAANQRTFGMNLERYFAKWGGPPGGETFETPFGLPVPLSFTTPDLPGRAARSW